MPRGTVIHMRSAPQASEWTSGGGRQIACLSSRRKLRPSETRNRSDQRCRGHELSSDRSKARLRKTKLLPRWTLARNSKVPNPGAIRLLVVRVDLDYER